MADESVDGPIVESLRINGHHVIYVAELDPGLDDEEVFRGANDSGAILVTADKDLGRLCFDKSAFRTASCSSGWRG